MRATRSGSGGGGGGGGVHGGLLRGVARGSNGARRDEATRAEHHRQGAAVTGAAREHGEQGGEDGGGEAGEGVEPHDCGRTVQVLDEQSHLGGEERRHRTEGDVGRRE